MTFTQCADGYFQALKAGFYETEYGQYPKLQILTIKELFDDRRPAISLIDPFYFKKGTNRTTTARQTDLRRSRCPPRPEHRKPRLSRHANFK